MSGPKKKTNQHKDLTLTEQMIKGLEQKIDKALEAIKEIRQKRHREDNA